MCAVYGFWVLGSVVVIESKLRGSYTVEATAVISLFCMLIALVIILGFYGHDQAVMKSTANVLAFNASLWKGRYVSMLYDEVDYGALKSKADIDLSLIESKGYEMMEQRLLLGKVQAVRATQTNFGGKVVVEIEAAFDLGKTVIYTVQSESRVFKSNNLPRNIRETGEEE